MNDRDRAYYEDLIKEYQKSLEVTIENENELAQQNRDLLAALKEAQRAIKSLNADALGFGGTDRYQWPLRDELLSRIDSEIARAEADRKSPLHPCDVELPRGDES